MAAQHTENATGYRTGHDGQCLTCNDDGWIDVDDEDGNPCGARDCPHLGHPDHARFNASGLIPDVAWSTTGPPERTI